MWNHMVPQSTDKCFGSLLTYVDIAASLLSDDGTIAFE